MSTGSKHFPKQRHYLATFFFSFFWGAFGIDRMYLGKWGTGFLKLVTFGGFGIWILVDLAMILSGTVRDKEGRELLQTAEYKSFAGKVTIIYALVVAMVVLINGALLIAAVTQFLSGMQDGTIPGFDALNGLQGSGLSPEDLQGLGL